MVRSRACGSSVSRLGDAALRPAVAAPGPGVRTPGDALPLHRQRLRRGHRAGHHCAAAAGATRVSRRAYLLPQAGAEARSGTLARAARAGRLCAHDAGGEPGRVLVPRRADRPVSDGQPGAVSHRPVRHRHRVDPHLRRGYPAQHLSGQGSTAAAGARVPARRSGARPLPAELPRALRGRPVAQPAVQGRGQRPRARRDRVLPAAVLRDNRHAVRLSAAGRDLLPASRRRAGSAGIPARYPVALPTAARRRRPPAAGAARIVSHH